MRRIFDEDVWPRIAAADPASKHELALKKESERITKELIPLVMIIRADKKRETVLLVP